MATVRLSDAIVPEVFANYMVNDTVEKADIFNSGIVVPDGMMASKLSSGGRLFQHPVWRDLDNTDPVIGTDNPADTITPLKLGSFKHQWIRQVRTQAWSTADLVSELAGSDPMQRISGRVTDYWSRYFNRTTVRCLNGIFNDNIANDSGDMVHDITAETGTVTVGGATVNAFSLHAGAIIEAAQTMGDENKAMTTLIMHSRLLSNLKLQNLIVYIPNSRGEVVIPTYLGYRVVETDTVPVSDQGGGVLHYTTYVCGPGVFHWAESPPANPIAVEREELQGNGMGVETLVTRRQYALHPIGFNFTDASTAAEFPTDAELELAANWDRAFPERKQIPLAAIITKNG